MRTNRLVQIAALAIALLTPALAHAQCSTTYTKFSLVAQVAANFSDNASGLITPATTRSTIDNIINSVQQGITVNAQAGTSYTVVTDTSGSSDNGKLITFNNASAIAVTLPAATGAAGACPFSFYALGLGAGAVTFTPAGGTINGAGTLVLAQNQSVIIIADGTNWQVVKGFGSGTVTGPGSSTVGGFAQWGNSTGTSLTSSGTILGLVLGTGAGAPTVYGGTSCAGQFVRSINASGVATCSSVLDADLSLTSPAIGAATATSLKTASIFPPSNSTTALQIFKADGSTRVVAVDTTNARVGINKTPGAFDLDVNGAANVGATLTFSILSPTSLGASPTTVTGLTVNNSPIAGSDYVLYYSSVNNAINKATISALTSAGVAGVSSLNGLTGGLSIVQGTGITVSAAGTSVTVNASAAQLPGTATNDSASAGNLGEYVEAPVVGGSSTAISFVTPKNVTSISLTAGDWDVSGIVAFNNVGATGTIAWTQCGISTTTATMPTVGLASNNLSIVNQSVTTLPNNFSVPCGPTRISASGTTTVYLVGQINGTGTPTINSFGEIRARRVR